MSNHTNGQGAALLTMGADDSGFPLAAIYRTIHGRRLRTTVTVVNDDDTDPPSSVPPGYMDVESDDIEQIDIEQTQEIRVEDTSEQAIRGAVELLRRLAPHGSDPRIVAEIVCAFAAETSDQNQREHSDEDAWYRQAFKKEVFLTRPPVISRSTRIEADFIRSTMAVATGSRVLDVGCGYGRLTNLLAGDGFDMVGLDLSEDMLSKAQAFAKRQGVAPEYVWGDMRDLTYEEEFDAVICTDSSFGYFEDSENLVALRKMVRALRPGGQLVLDVPNRDMAIHDVPGRDWWEGDGCLIQEDSDYVIETSRLRIKRLLVFSDGRQSETLISMRLYSAHELIAMCKLVGLDLVELSGGTHSKGAFFCESSPRLVLTARKFG